MGDLFSFIGLVIVVGYIVFAIIVILIENIKRLFSISKRNTVTPDLPAPEKPLTPPPTIILPKISKPEMILSPDEVFLKEYVSYTRIRTFYECPRKFELKYLYKLEEISGRAAQVGKLIHELIAAYFSRIEGEGARTINDARSFYNDALTNLTYLRPSALSINIAHTINKNELFRYLEHFALLNKRIEANRIVHEAKRVTEVGKYQLLCVIDRLDFQGSDLVRIVDYKTGDSSHVTQAQLNLYALSMLEEELKPIELQYQFLKDGTVKSWKYTKNCQSSIRKWLMEGIRAIKAKKRFPCKSSKYGCRYCGLAHHCDRSS